MRQRELVEGIGLSRNDLTGKREEGELGRSRVSLREIEGGIILEGYWDWL